MADTGCDMSEEELLAMLRGIDASKIQSESQVVYPEKSAQAEEKDQEATTPEDLKAETFTEFLAKNPEKHTCSGKDLNQYWYSAITIEKMVAEVQAHGGEPLKVAFVSTPSLFFSLTAEQRRECAVLDYDRKWESEPGFVFYDYNEPEAVPEEIKGTFDMLVIDPPYITREVWAQYAITAKLLLAPNGRVMLTTVAENAPMMKELLDVEPQTFRPSVPNLVYQYCLYTSYPSEGLDCDNPEITEIIEQKHVELRPGH
uniref:Protein-lysine N-methyltransferase n=1 Tax=Florenciella parvula TaxID=236787 RepID=A0A7S2BFX1_9STRA